MGPAAAGAPRACPTWLGLRPRAFGPATLRVRPYLPPANGGIRLQPQRVSRAILLQARHQFRARHPRVAAVAAHLQAHLRDAHQHLRLSFGGVGLAGVQPQRGHLANLGIHHPARVIARAVVVPVVARSFLRSVKLDQGGIAVYVKATAPFRGAHRQRPLQRLLTGAREQFHQPRKIRLRDALAQRTPPQRIGLDPA